MLNALRVKVANKLVAGLNLKLIPAWDIKDDDLEYPSTKDTLRWALGDGRQANVGFRKTGPEREDELARDLRTDEFVKHFDVEVEEPATL